jgi:hypothetical protein
MKTPTFLNRTQIISQCSGTDYLFRLAVREGALTPDAKDSNGRLLFSQDRLGEIRAALDQRKARLRAPTASFQFNQTGILCQLTRNQKDNNS